MARQLRIEYKDAYYHVMAHGNGFQWIYKSKQNMNDFIQILQEVKNKYNIFIHAFVLMQNHYHLLIETPEANLSKCMLKFNRDYSKLLNRFLKRKGAIFKQRYKSILVEKEYYYLNLIRYIYQNPIRCGIVKKAEEYTGSSLYLLNNNAQNMKTLLYLNDQINYLSKNNFIPNLINFVNDKIEDNPTVKSSGFLLGRENWINKIKLKINKNRIDEDILEKKELTSKIVNPLDIQKVAKKNNKYHFDSLYIYFSNKYSTITQKKLAEDLKLKNRYVISKRLQRFKQKIKTDLPLQEEINEIEKKLFLK